MVTVIGMVALILVAVAFATSTILGQILATNLDSRVAAAADQMRVSLLEPPQDLVSGPPTAYDVLTTGHYYPSGTLLILNTQAGGLSGAYIDEHNTVRRLTSAEINAIAVAAAAPGASQGFATVRIPGVDTYRVTLRSSNGANGGNGFYAFVGLPTSEVSATVAQILTTVVLVTTGGLLLLGVAIALIIRRGLQPLRAVADTAAHVAALPMSEGSVSILERVPEDQTDDRTEIGQVGRAMNTLLDHVSSSLTARQRNEELMRSFVADASHELRTPLASIRGYSELSLRSLQRSHGPEVLETTEQALERIQAQSLRMTTLVEDLLLLARLDEGQELVYGSVDLTRLCVEAVADAQAAGPEHTWELDVDDVPIEISGDASRLHQVLANLLGNARTHTPPGTAVTTRLQRIGSDAVITVHDDGPGIDPSVAEELFERFARADRSRARKTGGTGLGLSIARAIVQAHHGVITVRSTPGDTTFEVRIPTRGTPAEDQ
nr:HAMP domain-containing sensor histidine kinase [Microbacterium mangrovi]